VLTAALALTSELVPLLVVSVLAGVGAGMLNPAQQATVADVVGSERTAGPVLATFQMCSDAGQILGPVVAGLLVDHTGYGAAFALSGAITVLAALVWTRAPETLVAHNTR
jgi:MFS family permease